MGNSRKLLRQVLGGIGFILLGIALIFIFQWARENLVASSAGSQAYPPPEGKETTSVILSDTTPYPGPETQVSQNTIEPQSTLIPHPPPGWPTDQPWPPDSSSITPLPSQPVQPFPTPKNEQGLQVGLNGLDQIWFSYYPSFGAQPELWALKYNKDTQGWDSDRLSIDLDIPAPQPGPDPGPVLLQLHLSPDGKWLVADYAYRGSQLIDLSSGKSKTPAININSYWKFFNWMPTNSSLVSADEEYPKERIQHINLDTEEAKTVLLSEIEDNASLRGMAYSPDGNHLASAIIYTSSIGDKKTEIATVTLENDTKRTLINLPNGVSFVDHSLKWSPDGSKLLWIAQIMNDEGISETKLWVADIETGLVEAETSLGKSVQYNHTAAWSPDGTTVAFVKTETVKNSQESSNNLYVINLDTGQESNVTNYSNQLLSHLQWLSDGKRIAFLIAVGDYGEIWITNLDGSEKYPIAGPTLPNTPFLLISEGN